MVHYIWSRRVVRATDSMAREAGIPTRQSSSSGDILGCRLDTHWRSSHRGDAGHPNSVTGNTDW